MKTIIFDFDGTMVDSAQLVWDCLLSYTSNTQLTWEELRDLSSENVIKALKIPKIKLPGLILKIRRKFRLRLMSQKVPDGVLEAIRALNQRGFDLHIISSNSEENIRVFLKHHHILQCFKSINSCFTIFGKARSLSNLLKIIGVASEAAIYIGDETRDIEAAKKAGMKSMAVCWGYNSEKALRLYDPTFLAREPIDIVNLLEA